MANVISRCLKEGTLTRDFPNLRPGSKKVILWLRFRDILPASCTGSTIGWARRSCPGAATEAAWHVRNEKTITQPPNVSRRFETLTLTGKDLRGIYNSMIDKMYGVLYLSLFVLVNDCCIWDNQLLGTT